MQILDFAWIYATMSPTNSNVIGGLAAAAATVEKMSDASGHGVTGLFLHFFHFCQRRACAVSISLSDHFTCKKLLRFVAPSVLMMIVTSI